MASVGGVDRGGPQPHGLGVTVRGRRPLPPPVTDHQCRMLTARPRSAGTMSPANLSAFKVGDLQRCPAALPRALQRPPVRRARPRTSVRRDARLHRQVPPTYAQAAVHRDHPKDPLLSLRCPCPGRAVALDHGQPARCGRGTARRDTPAPADRRASGNHPRCGVRGRTRMGRNGVAGMTTGARRGELCALRWDRIELDRAALSVRSSSAQEGSRTWRRTPRPISSGASLSTQPRSVCEGPTAGTATRWRPPSASRSARPHDCSPHPRTIRRGLSRRQSANVSRGCAPAWDGTATSTSCGTTPPLSRSPPGSTSVPLLDGWDTAEAARPPLRTYAAWVSEADQRAAGTFDNHLPALPVNLDDLDEVVIAPGAETIRAAAAPYRRIGRPTGSHNVRGISHRRPPAHSGRTRRPLPGGSEYRTPGHLPTQHQRSSHRQPGRRTTVAYAFHLAGVDDLAF